MEAFGSVCHAGVWATVTLFVVGLAGIVILGYLNERKKDDREMLMSAIKRSNVEKANLERMLREHWSREDISLSWLRSYATDGPHGMTREQAAEIVSRIERERSNDER